MSVALPIATKVVTDITLHPFMSSRITSGTTEYDSMRSRIPKYMMVPSLLVLFFLALNSLARSINGPEVVHDRIVKLRRLGEEIR